MPKARHGLEVAPMMQSPTARLAWADAVRGFCVLAVVLSHVIGWGMGSVIGSDAEVFWEVASGQLTPIRMPTLFVLTGFLLSSRVRAGFADRRVLASVATSYYIYVIWLTIFGLLTLAGLSTGVSTLESYAAQLLLPQTILWFILGLALWTLVLGALHRVHPAIVLTVLAFLSVASFWVPGQNGLDQYTRILQYGFFFGLGVYGKILVGRVAAGRVWHVSIGALLMYLGVRVLMSFGSEYRPIEASLTIVRDTAAVAVTITAMAVLCRVPWIRGPLVWVGRRTLPIYVMHPLLIWAVAAVSGWTTFMDLPGATWPGPVLGAIVISLAAVGINSVMLRTPLRVLFELPDCVNRWIGRPSQERKKHHSSPPRVADASRV